MRTILKLALLSSLATGCYVNDNAQYAGGAVYVDSPDLVEVSPGVQVVADYDYPVFFTGGYYWRYDAGYWYSSPRWGGGWGRVANPPVVVTGISHPGSYTHYRPSGWSPRATAHASVVAQPARRDFHAAPISHVETQHAAPVVHSAPAPAPSVHVSHATPSKHR